MFDPSDAVGGAQLMLVNTAITTVGWLTVTFLTPPEPEAHLRTFYERTRPGGLGWRPIAAKAGLPDEPAAGGRGAWIGWGAGIVAVYGALFGVGRVLLGPRLEGVGFLLVAAIAFVVVARVTPAAQNPR